jgi:hypothetical protein
VQLTDGPQISSRLAHGRRARDGSTRVPIVRATLRGDRRSLSRRKAVHEVQAGPSGDQSRSRAPHSDGRCAANAGRTEFSKRQPTSGRVALECQGSKPLSRCKHEVRLGTGTTSSPTRGEGRVGQSRSGARGARGPSAICSSGFLSESRRASVFRSTRAAAIRRHRRPPGRSRSRPENQPKAGRGRAPGGRSGASRSRPHRSRRGWRHPKARRTRARAAPR